MVRLQVASNRARVGRRVGEPPSSVLVLAAQAAEAVVLVDDEATSLSILAIEDEHPKGVAPKQTVLRRRDVFILFLRLLLDLLRHRGRGRGRGRRNFRGWVSSAINRARGLARCLVFPPVNKLEFKVSER